MIVWCGNRASEPETVANAIAEELEGKYPDDILKAMVKNKGLKIDQT